MLLLAFVSTVLISLKSIHSSSSFPTLLLRLLSCMSLNSTQPVPPSFTPSLFPSPRRVDSSRSVAPERRELVAERDPGPVGASAAAAVAAAAAGAHLLEVVHAGREGKKGGLQKNRRHCDKW